MLTQWHGWLSVLTCTLWCLPFHLVSDSVEPKEGDILQAVFLQLLNCGNSLPVYLCMELYPLTPCQVDFNELPFKKKRAFIVLTAVFGSWTVLSFFNERINISYSLGPLFQRSQKPVSPRELLFFPPPCPPCVLNLQTVGRQALVPYWTIKTYRLCGWVFICICIPQDIV